MGQYFFLLANVCHLSSSSAIVVCLSSSVTPGASAVGRRWAWRVGGRAADTARRASAVTSSHGDTVFHCWSTVLLHFDWWNVAHGGCKIAGWTVGILRVECPHTSISHVDATPKLSRIWSYARQNCMEMNAARHIEVTLCLSRCTGYSLRCSMNFVTYLRRCNRSLYRPVRSM